MSQTKAQLIQPIGVVTAGGVVVTGVLTASSFDGEVVGTATSIISGGNLNLGDVNATTFSGDFTGNATGINTGADIKVGSFTATNFTGDFTGTATSMMRGTGFKAGAVNATGFVANVEGNVTGNVTGNVSVAGSVASGSNIHVGVITATSYSGDGSNLSGIAATNFNTQTVAAISATTTLDVSAGNMITLNQSENTTVSFANTSEAMDVTVIRKNPVSFTSGAVTFDGTDDTLTLAASSDFTFDGDFTVEGWFYSTYSADYDTLWGLGRYAGVTPNDGVAFYFGSNLLLTFYSHGSARITGPEMPQNKWTHIAIVRSGSTVTMYLNGTSEGTVTESNDFGTGSNNTFNIGTSSNASSTNVDFFQGKISNFRVVKGTAVYTSDFNPPFYQLTDITNTKLLCCQDTSSATTAAVKPGTITAVSSPAAASATIENSEIELSAMTLTWPSSVKWNGGIAPTTLSGDDTDDTQQFEFLTRDSGATWYAWEPFSFDAPYRQLWGVGQNGSGTLGDNTATSRSSPIQIGSATTWKASKMDNGQYAADMIKTDGTLWIWGHGVYGQTGHNSTDGISSPMQLPGTWKDVSGGSYMTVAVRTNGTLWTFGRNDDYGQLGQNNRTNYSSPLQVGTGTDWKACYADAGIMVASKTNGTLWTWGNNSNGALGKNNKIQYSSPVQVPGTSWGTKMGGCWGGFAVFKTDGTLWSWGDNDRGQIGANFTGQRSSPVQIPGTTWDKVSGGYYNFYIATKTDGTLWSWGYNGYGALGLNSSNVHRSSPTQIPGSYQDGSAGGHIASAVKTDGTLWSWGYNNQGQIGQNATSPQHYSSPTQVGTDTNWKGVSNPLLGGVFATKTPP